MGEAQLNQHTSCHDGCGVKREKKKNTRASSLKASSSEETPKTHKTFSERQVSSAVVVPCSSSLLKDPNSLKRSAAWLPLSSEQQGYLAITHNRVCQNPLIEIDGARERMDKRCVVQSALCASCASELRTSADKKTTMVVRITGDS
uniref:Uncharacterized protein n=1 Tax=Anopheles minimus TaxID=112268 RepID=A0A182W2S6_9DIPT